MKNYNTCCFHVHSNENCLAKSTLIGIKTCKCCSNNDDEDCKGGGDVGGWQAWYLGFNITSISSETRPQNQVLVGVQVNCTIKFNF